VRGVRRAEVHLDGRRVSPDGGFVFRKGAVAHRDGGGRGCIGWLTPDKPYPAYPQLQIHRKNRQLGMWELCPSPRNLPSEMSPRLVYRPGSVSQPPPPSGPGHADQDFGQTLLLARHTHARVSPSLIRVGPRPDDLRALYRVGHRSTLARGTPVVSHNQPLSPLVSSGCVVSVPIPPPIPAAALDGWGGAGAAAEGPPPPHAAAHHPRRGSRDPRLLGAPRPPRGLCARRRTCPSVLVLRGGGARWVRRGPTHPKLELTPALTVTATAYHHRYLPSPSWLECGRLGPLAGPSPSDPHRL